jgi:hypothetical protein
MTRGPRLLKTSRLNWNKLSPPDVIGTFTPEQFLIALANYLGEPCPIFSRLQGQFIAHCAQSRCVDMYGNAIAAISTLPGDHRRQFHNEIVRVVGNFARTANIPSTREPHNMLESGIPAEPFALWQASGGWSGACCRHDRVE